MTPIWGFSQAANSMVSNVIGQGKKDEVLSLVGKIVRMSFVIGTISTILVLLFPDFIFQLSTSDKAIIESAKGSFYVISFANIIFSMSMVLLSSVSGTGNTKAAMVIEIINIVVYLLYVFIFTIVLPSRVEIVWGCEILYWAMMALFSFLYLKSGKWKNYKLSNYEID
jgi:Na+-driven multidrug efflux pump